MSFKSGKEWNGNRHGRPRVPEAELIRIAIEEVSREKKKSLWKHLAEQCYLDNSVLIALSKKFLPDQIKMSVDPESNKIIVEFKK